MNIVFSNLLSQTLSEREGLVLFAVISVAALSLAIADDWWKRYLVARARKRGKQVPEKWLNNRTDWRILAFLILFFVIGIVLMANPQLLDRDFGPFDPIIRHLFTNGSY